MTDDEHYNVEVTQNALMYPMVSCFISSCIYTNTLVLFSAFSTPPNSCVYPLLCMFFCLKEWLIFAAVTRSLYCKGESERNSLLMCFTDDDLITYSSKQIRSVLQEKPQGGDETKHLSNLLQSLLPPSRCWCVYISSSRHQSVETLAALSHALPAAPVRFRRSSKRDMETRG